MFCGQWLGYAFTRPLPIRPVLPVLPALPVLPVAAPPVVAAQGKK